MLFLNVDLLSNYCLTDGLVLTYIAFEILDVKLYNTVLMNK